MKKIFTFFALLAAMSLSASNINLHLTGCTSNAGNPTEYTDEDDWVELYFTANAGYTLLGADVVVKHGTDEISTDYMDEFGYYYYEGSMGYLFISWYEDITEDFEVYITAKEQVGPSFPMPEIVATGTFENIVISGENSVYRPSTFAEGKNWFLTGSYAMNTSVQDWGSYGMGYSSMQVVNYKNGFVPDGNDVYLATAANGAAAGNNFGVCNIMGLYEEMLLTPTTISGMAVTNTMLAANSVFQGDAYAAGLSEGGYFRLNITGLKDGVVKGTVNYNLANYPVGGEMTFAENWQWVDLSSLGIVDNLQFSLEGTDMSYGYLNTPSYFCVDQIGGVATDCNLGELTHAKDVKLTENFATMCWDKAWTVEEDVELYTGKWNAAESCIDLYRLAENKVPANAAVVMYTQDETKASTRIKQIHEEVAPLSNNDLKGVTTATTLAASSSRYVLALNNNRPAFCKYMGTEIPANRAYLDIPGAGAAVRMRIVNATTDLEQTPYVNDNMIYDVMGRVYGTDRVALQQGIYIQNGEKFVVK